MSTRSVPAPWEFGNKITGKLLGDLDDYHHVDVRLAGKSIEHYKNDDEWARVYKGATDGTLKVEVVRTGTTTGGRRQARRKPAARGGRSRSARRRA